MAEANSNDSTIEYNEVDHFPVAAAVNVLLQIAGKYDREGVVTAARLMDMSHTELLRGMSFISECLDAVEDAPMMQMQLAKGAIREVNALCAVLIELGADAQFYRLVNESKEVAL